MNKTGKLTAAVLVLSMIMALTALADNRKPQSPKNSAGTSYRESDITWVPENQGMKCIDNKTGKAFASKWVHVSGEADENHKRKSQWYYFDADGTMHTGWLNYDGDTFYLRPDGTAVTEEITQEIDGATYMFNLHGTIYKNETITRKGIVYTFDELGRLTSMSGDKSGQNEIHSSRVDQVEYLNAYRREKGISPLQHDSDFDAVAKSAFDYASANGGTISLSAVYSLAVSAGHPVNHIGFIFATARPDDSYMYLTEEAKEALRNLWFTRVGYYKGESDIMIIIAAYDGEAATQLSPDDAQGKWVMQDTFWMYQKTDGSFAVSSWLLNPKDSKWYHFDENGHMQTGWFEDADGKWYYLDPLSGEMAVSTTVDGRYLGDDGAWVQ